MTGVQTCALPIFTAESNGKDYTMFTVILPSAEYAVSGGENND